MYEKQMVPIFSEVKEYCKKSLVKTYKIFAWTIKKENIEFVTWILILYATQYINNM